MCGINGEAMDHAMRLIAKRQGNRSVKGHTRSGMVPPYLCHLRVRESLSSAAKSQVAPSNQQVGKFIGIYNDIIDCCLFRDEILNFYIGLVCIKPSLLPFRETQGRRGCLETH